MLTTAFNNTERAFSKKRVREPWDFLKLVEIIVFAVLVIPLVFHFTGYPKNVELRKILCDVNYCFFSGLALSAVIYICKNGSFNERIRITVLLAALAMPALLFMTLVDFLAVTGMLESLGDLLENSVVMFIVGLIPLAGTIIMYSALKKIILQGKKEEKE